VDRSFVIGFVLTVVSVVGYLVGVDASYPGRAFSLTALMVGIFFGGDWLVTASQTTVGAIDTVWQAMIDGRAKFLGLGADFAAYRVLDPAEEGLLTDLNALRRDLLAMRKLLWPTR
jgi:magnesium transporter